MGNFWLKSCCCCCNKKEITKEKSCFPNHYAVFFPLYNSFISYIGNIWIFIVIILLGLIDIGVINTSVYLVLGILIGTLSAFFILFLINMLWVGPTISSKKDDPSFYPSIPGSTTNDANDLWVRDVIYCAKDQSFLTYGIIIYSIMTVIFLIWIATNPDVGTTQPLGPVYVANEIMLYSVYKIIVTLFMLFSIILLIMFFDTHNHVEFLSLRTLNYNFIDSYGPEYRESIKTTRPYSGFINLNKSSRQ